MCDLLRLSVTFYVPMRPVTFICDLLHLYVTCYVYLHDLLRLAMIFSLRDAPLCFDDCPWLWWM